MSHFFLIVGGSALLLVPVFLIIWVILAIRKKPTRKAKFACLVCVITFLLFEAIGMSMRCDHVWQGASCTSPRTCIKCGETQGDPLDHTWKDATCTTPKICSVCGVTEGSDIALGHDWVEATCTEPNTCRVCGKTAGEALGHSFGEWEIEREPTVSTSGMRTRSCNRCGEKVETEPYELDSFIQNSKFIFTPEEFRTLFFDHFVDLGYSRFGGASVKNKEGQVVVDIRDFSYNNVGNIGFVVNGDELLMASSESDNSFDGLIMMISAEDGFIASAMISMILSCDPSLSEFEARSIGSDVLSDNVTRNGIEYRFDLSGDLAMMIARVAD